MNMPPMIKGGARPTTWHLASCRLALRKWQRGQAMPLGIASIMVGMLGAFVLFNTGQVAVNKQRLSDAADSAAYSGMVWQARALNFQAYTNRAMIANDVTIGQAVSLASWSTYAAIGSNNLATGTSFVPILSQITAGVATVFTTVQNVIEPVSDVLVSAVSVINEAISTSQEMVFASAFIATPDIVNQVANASDEHFESLSGYALAGMAMNLGDWEEFTQGYSDIDAMRERTDMISDSRDDFSKGRRWKFFDKIWFFYTPFQHYRVYYDGKTQLLMSENESGELNWEWVSKDAVSLHTKTYYFDPFEWKKRIVQLPIGWAAAYANSDGSDDSQTIDERRTLCKNYTTRDGDACEDFLENNGTAEVLADAGTPDAMRTVGTSKVGLSGYRGVNAFRSLSQTVLEEHEDSGDPVIRLRTEVSMDIEGTETTNDWIDENEPFATELASAGEKLSSISIGEVYYRHPKAYSTTSPEISMQRANGYNPYWDVRLAPVEIEERLAALALRPNLGNGGTGSVAPGANQLASFAGDGEVVDFELGGNVSGLSDYVSTVAGAMELDDQLAVALQDNALSVLTERTGFTASDIANFEALADINAIEDELSDLADDALEEAKNQLLGLIDPFLTSQGVDVDGLVNTAEEIADEALAINERMEEIRVQVSEDFEAALIQYVGPYEVVVEGITDRISELGIELRELNDEINGPNPRNGLIARREAVLDQIALLEEQILIQTEELKDTITDSVLDSIETYGGDIFEGAFEGTARDFLEDTVHPMILEYLTTTLEERENHEPGGVLPWDDEIVIDEEDTYSEDDYGKFED